LERTSDSEWEVDSQWDLQSDADSEWEKQPFLKLKSHTVNGPLVPPLSTNVVVVSNASLKKNYSKM
jgi:hypothetical protein